jgi:hypothetical protein
MSPRARRCAHLWLPWRSLLYRQIRCPHCGEARKVTTKWEKPEPRNITEALDEAVRLGVLSPNENRWRRTIR